MTQRDETASTAAELALDMLALMASDLALDLAIKAAREAAADCIPSDGPLGLAWQEAASQLQALANQR